MFIHLTKLRDYNNFYKDEKGKSHYTNTSYSRIDYDCDENEYLLIYFQMIKYE